MKYNQGYFNSQTEKKREIFIKYVEFLTNNKIFLRGGRILDIGCGTGIFFDCIGDEIDCVGLDISEYALQVCREKHKRKIFLNCDINYSIDLIGNQFFNIITMFDVIEHLINFDNLSSLVENNLSDDGFLIISTPNANSLLRFVTSNYSGENDKSHSMIFTPYTLDFFLRRLGLKKISLSTPYAFYFKNNILTKYFLLGGQIFAIYKK